MNACQRNSSESKNIKQAKCAIANFFLGDHENKGLYNFLNSLNLSYRVKDFL